MSSAIGSPLGASVTICYNSGNSRRTAWGDRLGRRDPGGGDGIWFR
jgi:hypothetical protein